MNTIKAFVFHVLASRIFLSYMLRGLIFNLKMHVEIGHHRTPFKKKIEFVSIGQLLSIGLAFCWCACPEQDFMTESARFLRDGGGCCSALLADKLVNSLRWNHDMMCMCVCFARGMKQYMQATLNTCKYPSQVSSNHGSSALHTRFPGSALWKTWKTMKTHMKTGHSTAVWGRGAWRVARTSQHQQLKVWLLDS